MITNLKVFIPKPLYQFISSADLGLCQVLIVETDRAAHLTTTQVVLVVRKHNFFHILSIRQQQYVHICEFAHASLLVIACMSKLHNNNNNNCRRVGLSQPPTTTAITPFASQSWSESINFIYDTVSDVVESGVHCGSNFQIASRVLKKCYKPILMYIYGKQYDFMHRSC